MSSWAEIFLILGVRFELKLRRINPQGMKRHSRFLCKTLVLPLVAAAILLQFGCGKKISAVLKQYEGDFKKKREQLQTIARSLPSEATEKPCPSLQPPLQFNEKTRSFNTEMLMFEQVADPDAKPEFDLLLSGDLLNALRWTGPQNPLSSSVLGNRGDDIEKSLKSALDYRYLVVNRVADLKKPEAINETTYAPGRVTLNVFVVDLANSEVLCRFGLRAESAARTSYTYKKGESQAQRLADFANSTMWEDARKKLIAKLKEMGVGEIELR